MAPACAVVTGPAGLHQSFARQVVPGVRFQSLTQERKMEDGNQPGAWLFGLEEGAASPMRQGATRRKRLSRGAYRLLDEIAIIQPYNRRCRRGISLVETHLAFRPKRYARVRRWQRQ